jgi:hypothetical protein
MFPHPRNPMGGFPIKEAVKWYDGMLSNGVHTHRNYLFFRNRLLQPLFKYMWHRSQERLEKIEGANAADARAVRAGIREITKDVPVICTGGFQTASKICRVIESGDCDAVSIARPLVANNEMVKYFERGEEVPEKKRCTYCNKCLMNVLENPLGCYELSRYDGDYEAMIKEVMTVFEPKSFP